MTELKYKKKLVGIKSIHRNPGWVFNRTLYRLQALRDIPEHGVKTGDWGGYVTKNVSLSHEGSCWIGGEAQVLGSVVVSDSAYIGDMAVVHSHDRKTRLTVKEDAKIFGNSNVSAYTEYQKSPGIVVVAGKAQIFGSATVFNTRLVQGNAKVYGSCTVRNTSLVTDNAEIFGRAFTGAGCQILGSSKIDGTAVVNLNAVIENTNISKNARIESQYFVNGEISKNVISSSISKTEQVPSVEKQETAVIHAATSNKALDAYHEALRNISSYETDIVNIIKYPVMTDRTNPFTREMVMAVNNANRYMDAPDSKDFKEAVFLLENAFLAAESNARKVASTLLSEEEKKKTERAKDMFRIASNEVSSDQEKKVAFKQGFRQLEGIIDIPDIAVDTFRIKIGLKELES